MVKRGVAAAAQQLLANSSALEETARGHQERLRLGEYPDPWGDPDLGDT